jgi:hypothetical protein
MLHCQSSTQFEEALAITVAQFVHNGPPDRRRNGLEHIAHGPTIGKLRLACQALKMDLVSECLQANARFQTWTSWKRELAI